MPPYAPPVPFHRAEAINASMKNLIIPTAACRSKEYHIITAFSGETSLKKLAQALALVIHSSPPVPEDGHFVLQASILFVHI